jgi:D-arabinose 1-dehydrogenase-like Zn-dependent alcohol dehydrogenase
LVDGLAPDGTILLSAVPSEPLTISALALFLQRRSVKGWYTGTAKDSEDTMEFSALSGVRPAIETYPLDRVADAYERMRSGKVRFRAVLTLGD